MSLVLLQVVAELKFDIARAYDFHKSNSVDVAVDFWRFDVSSVPDDIITAQTVPPLDEIGPKEGTKEKGRYPSNGQKRRYRGRGKQRK